jgi:hypothetical protein
MAKTAVKVIQLEPDVYEYLIHVVKVHAGAGIQPEEAIALHLLWQGIQTAQVIDIPPTTETYTNPAG